MYWIFFPVHIPYNYYCHTISTSTINKIIIIILIISTMMAEIILSVTPAANVESTTENTMIKLSNKDFGFLRHHLRREMRKTKRKTNWYGRLARWSSLLYSASVEFEKHVNLPLVSLRETADRLFGDDRSQSSGSRFAWSRSASGSDGIRGKTYEILQTFYENPFMLIKTSGFEMNDDHGLKSLLSSNKRQRKTAPFAQE